MAKDIKIKLLRIDKKQVDLLNEIRKRGYPTLSPQSLSSYISGYLVSPQADAVLKIARDILKEWENEKIVH